MKMRTQTFLALRTMRTMRTGIFPTFQKLTKNADNADNADRHFSNISKAEILDAPHADIRKPHFVRMPVRKKAFYLSGLETMRTMRTGVFPKSTTTTTKGIVGGRTASLYINRKNAVRIGRTQTEAAA